MNIKIKDIGKIEYADIALDGITIIAGENNTGKSTIGKTVFAVLGAVNNWQEVHDGAFADEVRKVLGKSLKVLGSFCDGKMGVVRDWSVADELLINSYCDKDFIACVQDYRNTDMDRTDDVPAAKKRLIDKLNLNP